MSLKPLLPKSEIQNLKSQPPASIRFWDRRADRYEAQLPPRGPNYAARLQRVLAVAPPNARVLDVGCATGQITLDLADRLATTGGSVLGLDLAPRMIHQAQARLHARALSNVTFAAIHPDHPSLQPGTFDVVTCYSVFHLVPHWPALLQRVADLLKPAGHLLTETPCLGDWPPWCRPLFWTAQLTRAAPPLTLIRRARLEAAFTLTGNWKDLQLWLATRDGQLIQGQVLPEPASLAALLLTPPLLTRRRK